MKRLFDLVFSFCCLLFLSPFLFVISSLIYIMMGFPILFKQPRAGLHGKLFMIYKFRTMTDETDRNGNLLPDSQRTTGIGRFLRKTSVDELPQLLNVVIGDLSIVGPRPLHVAYLPRYSRKQALRHEVKPGITGWAQINGRNTISWEEKFKHDIWYVENRSFWLDLKIILVTVFTVLKMKDINAKEKETMPEFTGADHKEKN